MRFRPLSHAHSFAGGKESFDAAIAWARVNLSEADRSGFDRLVRSDTVGRQAAVGWMMNHYHKAVGTPGTLLVANRSGMEDDGDNAGAYASLSEMVKDMSSPEYKASEQFRQHVQRKLAANQRQKIDIGIRVMRNGDRIA
jgi:hypothetical protein